MVYESQLITFIKKKGDWGWDIKIKIMVYDKKKFNG